MKFMKLGSRPDTFYTLDGVRSVSSEVPSDLIVQVEGTRYLLHKFPLLSKCLRLQRLPSEPPSSLSQTIVELPDFVGGIDAFEICAKFCYGVMVTVSAYNIVAVRCAAEYLQMTEDVEKGNLIYKLEVFFNSCILHGWRDSIVTLQSTKAFHLWSKELGITTRCIEAIASRVLGYPRKANLSHSCSRRVRDDVSCSGTSKGWWAEDIADLSVDLFWRTMIAIKSGGKMPPSLVGEALKIYASRWLPNLSKNGNVNVEAEEIASRHRLLLESIISLLPTERGAVSCSFLLKLLKAVNILNASSSSKVDLIRRVGIQLEEAKVNDLLIPSPRANDTVYDVDVVLSILEQFMLQGLSPPTSPARVKGEGFERRRRSRSAENVDFEYQESSRRSSSASHSSKLKVVKLVDGYLQEIAHDPNLPLSKMVALAESVPDFARIDHDNLYRAIDIYLKAHPDLNKHERKRLCRTLDCKKLSEEACMHAAQNELLPLRVVVQVLFFEQARAAMAGGQVTELPKNIKAIFTAHDRNPSTATASVQAEDQWSVSGLKSPRPKLSTTLRMKLAEADDNEDNVSYSDRAVSHTSTKLKGFCAIPSRPKRMFSKFWSVNRSGGEKQ